MTGGKYRVFLSSSMSEFKQERAQIVEALENAYELFTYENDAGARPQSIQKTYYEEIDRSDVYVGLFGAGYGKYTIDEFERARDMGIPCFIYEKEMKPHERDAELSQFLSSITGVTDKEGLSTRWFKEGDSLGDLIMHDLAVWTKSKAERGSSSGQLNADKKYYCNRRQQLGDFQIALEEEKNFNFFLVDGGKKQSHKGLVKRFGMHYDGKLKTTIRLNQMSSLERLKSDIRRELFTGFDISPLPTKIEGFSMENLIKNTLHTDKERIFVAFEMREDLLGDTTIQKALHWFATTYCQAGDIPEGAPKFHFFLNVKYRNPEASQKRKVRKQLEKFTQYIKLEQLENVTTDDIDEWFDKHGFTETETAKEAVLDKYFTEEEYPMEMALIKISELISKYNQSDQELYALIHKY